MSDDLFANYITNKLNTDIFECELCNRNSLVKRSFALNIQSSYLVANYLCICNEIKNEMFGITLPNLCLANGSQ